MSGMFNFDVPDFGIGSSIVGASNPFASVGMSILSGMMNSQKVRISKTSAMGEAMSGKANAEQDNSLKIGGAQITLDEPKTLAIAALAVVAAIFVLKKIKR